VAKRAGFILCLVVCALGVGASHARADDPPPPPPAVIATDVQIGPVDVSGLTAGQATAAVEQAYFARVVVRVGHHGWSVSPHHFHTALGGLPAAVQTALTALPDTAIPLTPTLDVKLVARWVKALAAKTYRAPVAGTLLLRQNRPFFTHAHPGRALRALPTRMLLRDAIVSGDHTPIKAPLRTIDAASVKAEPVIVIHRGINRLFLYTGTHLVRVFPVATGQAAWPTPLGHFQIVVKQKNPWWFPPTQDSWAAGAKPVPPGPGNPLGTRWMGLSVPGVGIHGTDEPWSIGHSESHGCIRMQVPSAEWLFNRVRIGTPVFIVPA
jgi:lipoprotein-anchoring transpeptidase ErfK/SrfK